MLLNFSNHPSGNWSAEQRQAALSGFKGIEDLPFPSVDPGADESEIGMLARQYGAVILERPDARDLTVHVMGEMTFTTALVNLLLHEGIPCVASTTERSVLEEEDGRKTVVFRFVRFRKYVLPRWT